MVSTRHQLAGTRWAALAVAPKGWQLCMGLREISKVSSQEDNGH